VSYSKIQAIYNCRRMKYKTVSSSISVTGQ